MDRLLNAVVGDERSPGPAQRAELQRLLSENDQLKRQIQELRALLTSGSAAVAPAAVAPTFAVEVVRRTPRGGGMHVFGRPPAKAC